MASLFQMIQKAVEDEAYVVGQHAVDRLEERGILEWQVVVALATGKLIHESQKAKPNPKVEVEQMLPDGTEFKAVWSWLPTSGVAKLVTIHFYGE